MTIVQNFVSKNLTSFSEIFKRKETVENNTKRFSFIFYAKILQTFETFDLKGVVDSNFKSLIEFFVMESLKEVLKIVN